MKAGWGVFAGLALLSGCGEPAPSDQPAAVSVAASPPAPDIPAMGAERRILAFGDSLFAGYGVRPAESYPARLEAALRAKGINARISNAGVSGDTTAAALQRLKFTLDSQKPTPEIVLISLGGNDMLRGLPPAQTRANLDAILSELDKRKIKAVVMGLLAAPNLGADYARDFNRLYPDLARKHGAALVPFFLEAVIDKPELLQADRIHPTREGIEAMVRETVAHVARELPTARGS